MKVSFAALALVISIATKTIANATHSFLNLLLDAVRTVLIKLRQLSHTVS